MWSDNDFSVLKVVLVIMISEFSEKAHPRRLNQLYTYPRRRMTLYNCTLY